MKIDEMEKRLKGRLKERRYKHSKGVAEEAVKLARRNEVEEEKAYIAGLLHDCGREYEEEEMIKEAERRNIAIGEIERANPMLLHAYIGAIKAKEEYGIEEEEIIAAIWRHTVGGKNMSKLEKIIYLADMIEESREYEGVEELREIVKTKELDEVVEYGMEETIKYVIKKRKMIHPETIMARNEILMSRKE